MSQLMSANMTIVRSSAFAPGHVLGHKSLYAQLENGSKLFKKEARGFFHSYPFHFIQTI